MRTVDELLEQAKHLSPRARKELRDRLDESLGEEPAESADEGPYASLLKSAGAVRSLSPDVARNKHEHLADIYAGKRSGR